MRTEVTIAVERAESRASEQRANWSVKEASLSDQCIQLKRELESSQASLKICTGTIVQVTRFPGFIIPLHVIPPCFTLV